MLIEDQEEDKDEEEETPQKKASYRFFGCCCKKKEEFDPDLVEHVEIHLDGCGKHGLIMVYAFMQFASIFTFCIFYYQYYIHTCNPSGYKINDPFF